MPEMSAVEGLTLETPVLESLYGGQLTFRVFIRSRQPANSGGYFRYQRRLLLLTFAIRTLKVYFFILKAFNIALFFEVIKTKALVNESSLL